MGDLQEKYEVISVLKGGCPVNPYTTGISSRM